jgi:acetolactate synthase-1/2/3 large subunit
MQFRVPAGKTIIQITNEDRDINKDTPVGNPIIGDAKPVLTELIALVKKKLGKDGRKGESTIAREIKKVKDEWLAEWMPKLTSEESPLNPYRVIWELMHTIPPRDAIVTHDAGGPRNQILPFYTAIEPRSYIGWGKSHQLGTGLGLIMGAKLAKPEKVCINLMGDAAIGMVGMDFETAARNKIPIITIVLNNFIMAVEKHYMPISHEKYGSRFTTGDYAKIGEALGGYAERIEKPKDIAPALRRARRITEEEKRPVLLEFITCEECAYSNPS